MDKIGLARIFAAMSGKNLDQEQAKTKLLNAQADTKNLDVGSLVAEIEKALANEPNKNNTLSSSVMDELSSGQPQPQSTGSGISRRDWIKALVKSRYNIELPKTEDELMKERSDKLNDEVAKKELSSMVTNLPKLEQALQSINQLEDLYYKGATPDKSPLQARLTGLPDTLRARMGGNPDLNTYLNNRKAFAGLVAKGGFGEAGMLTNQDIERVVAALPNPGSTKDEAQKGFSEIKTLLGAARERFEKTKKNYLSGKIPGQQSNDTDPLGLR